MKLTRLELSGFKSFADTVILDFEEGVTAIVGPNGCGKSNVSDAVRWVLGEQSARLLRGGKMEDVIFQGAANRRPVNVTEVSLHLDNDDGTLPVAYREVVVTRRLSRSGTSEYLLNNAPVRLRDIQDLLRGTGMGSDAGVVIEARMIDLLLSDRADERRSLFEEAAGIGLYRDRKHATERRLEETAADLQRLEDLVAEIQSQIRSLARQKGRAERHARLSEERFLVHVTLAVRQLEDLARQAAGIEERHAELAIQLPAMRRDLTVAIATQEERSRVRAAAETHRAGVSGDLAEGRIALARLDADISVAAERLASSAARQARAEEERAALEVRAEEARQEGDLAGTEREEAERDHARVLEELHHRAEAEEEVRRRLVEQRETVRTLEQEFQSRLQTLRALEGERNALEVELASLRERAEAAATHRRALEGEQGEAERRAREMEQASAAQIAGARDATALAARIRHHLAETREREAGERADRRRAEEAVAQLSARRQALEALEHARVGLAPGAAALLEVRDRFNGAVLGPLSDFLSADQADAELAERVLGDLVHAVLVRDAEGVAAIQRWHGTDQPGALVLLPADPGPLVRDGRPHPLAGRLRVEEPAAAWVDALAGGSEVLEASGRVLRRPSGAVYLGAASDPTGPIRRRADLAQLAQDVAREEAGLRTAEAALGATRDLLTTLEAELERTTEAAAAAQEAERRAVGLSEDAARVLANVQREVREADLQLGRVHERLEQAERRMAEIDAHLADGERVSARVEESLGTARTALTALEADREAAREARLHWQVQEAHLGARLRSAGERLERVTRTLEESHGTTGALRAEVERLETEIADLTRQHATWDEQRAERQLQVEALEVASAEADTALAGASTALVEAEQSVADLRTGVEILTEEHHRLELELAQVTATRRSIRERVETEWHAPLEELLKGAQPLELETLELEQEAERIAAALEAIGPVNPLAMEEHAEETRRLEFLVAQRDDLVAARHSLLQAIREIDGTARTLFLETFEAIQGHFQHVFATLFGGGECDLRLAVPDDPLESEIEIHAAPRGKRTQRIHLLSSGERTLVATSLLFAIYLTKPSPFCLMDEVDAPLDDANVGRFTTLLKEFQDRTQFVVITHNPRTMQAANAVYGVTMQEPGVSTIVGVRLSEYAAGVGA